MVVARQVRRVPANARVAVERAVTRDAGRTPWMYTSFLMSMCSSSTGLWRAGLNMGGHLDAAETSFVRNRIPRANTFRLPCDAKINEEAGMVCRLLWRIPGVFIAAIMTCAPIWAQDSPSRLHLQTSSLPNARFEVLQSTLAVRHTYRLDRFSGRVWQLVRTKADDNAWEEMPVIDSPKIAAPSRARFQLFTSGFSVRHTFLLDTDSGKSWVVVTSKQKGADGSDFEIALWQPFAE